MRPALLVIDVQRGLFDDAPRPFEADLVVARINALAAKARTAGAPVVWIQHERAEGLLAHGSESWQLESQLQTQAGDCFVRKATPDSFLRTPLADLLAERGVDHLVICGYATEFCVDTTTRRAMALGFPVTLVGDAHTTHDKPHADAALIRAHHNATLSSISSFGPRTEVLLSDQIVFAPSPR